MQLWLETIDLPLIEKGVRSGLLQGVVTTPALLIEHGKPKELISTLLSVQPGPVVVDIYSDFKEKASQIAQISSRIVLRIPAVEEAWESIHQLSKNKHPVIAGAIFSPVQALLAARAGAAFVSPHISRMLKTGEKPFEQIESIQKMLTQYQFPTQLLPLHPKSAEQVKACAEIGAGGIIVRDDLYNELFETHELAAFHVEQSQEEWNKGVVLFFSNH